MNDAKHTKGPWKLQDDETPWTCGDARTAIEEGEELGHTEILSSLLAGEEGDDWPIAYLVWEPLANEKRCDELRANARLIAAAPDLLEACKAAWAELDNRYDVDVPEPGHSKEYPFNGAGELMRRLQAAIRKAEGR